MLVSLTALMVLLASVSVGTASASAAVSPPPPVSVSPSIPTPPAAKLPADAPTSSPFAATPTPMPPPPHDAGVPASALPAHGGDPVSAAFAQAQVTGKPVEVVSEETDTTTTFANPNGTLTTDVSSGPVRVARGTGFVPVDPTLVAANATVAPKAAEGGTELSAGSATGGAELASLTAAGGGHVGFRWPSPLPTPTLSGATATYHNVIAGGDLVVTATTTGFEFSVVLTQAPATPPVFSVPLSLSGLTLAQDPAGSLTLSDAGGHTVAASPAPTMFSAAVDPHAGVATQVEPVATSVVQGPGGPTLVLRPDFAFLTDPSTVYPVTIDPASNLTSDLSNYVASDYPNQNYDSGTELHVGTYNGGATKTRSFIRFNDSAIKGATVTSAVLNVYETWAYSCNAAQMWVDGTTSPLNSGSTWNNQPGVDGAHWYNGSFAAGYTGCAQGPGYQPLDITGLGQKWSSSGGSADALAMLAQDETNSYQWKKFASDNTTTAPYVAVTYNSPTGPSAPQNVAAAPGNAAVTISWAQPAYLGQPAMTAYYIYNYEWNGTSWVYQTYNSCTYPCTSTVFSGLTNGATYAANVYGWSASTGLGAPGYGPAYTPAGPPGAPTNVVAGGGNASATVRWSAPASNGGMALDYYLLDAVDLSNNNLQFLNTACGTCTNGTVSGLTNGHGYAIDVWAHNALAGYGAAATSNDLVTGATDPSAGAGQRGDFTQQTFTLTDKLTATVNEATGNLELSATDIVLPAVNGSLPLGRTFNSLAAAAGSSTWFSPDFGYTWRFNQVPDVRLTLNADGSAAYDTTSGNVATFAVSGSTYVTPAGMDATLVKNGDSTFTLSFHQSGEVQHFGVDGNLVSDADRNGNTLNFSYVAGRLVTTIVSDAGAAPSTTATITYGGPAGRVSSITQSAVGGGSRTVSYTYDPTGVTLESVTNANGGVTSYGYDANDNVTQVTAPAPLSSVTKFTYDTSHRVLSVDRVVPGSPDQITSYDYTTPNQTKITDGDGHPPVVYSTNSAGQVTGATDGDGNSTATTYTPDAKIGTFQNASGGMTTNTYGKNNGESLTISAGPTGAQVQASYNTPGLPYLPDSVTDAMGNKSLLTYNGPGNLATNTNALNNAAKLTYNPDGTVATATDPNNTPGNGNSTHYGYNSVHQLTSITPPTGSTLGGRSFTYDGFGRLATVTATGTTTVTTTYGYDNLDRLRSQSFSDGSHTISYTYDSDGNLNQLTDATGTTTYTYSDANQLTSEAIPGGTTLTYTYDPAGNLATAGGDGRPNPVVYHYNKANELDQMTDANGGIDIFAYNADHQRTDTWDGANGPVAYDNTGNHVIAPTGFAAHINTSYDTANQLTDIKTTRASSDTTVVADLAYIYSVANPASCPNETAGLATGSRQSVTDHVAGTTTSYCYDQAGRLTVAATAGGATYNYGYDGDGNRSADAAGTHSFNSANQLTDPGVTYDTNTQATGAGNLTASPAYPTIAYNSTNQTTAITTASPGALTLNAVYAGPGQNLRTSTTVSGVTTSYINGLLGVQAQTTNGATTTYDKDPQGTLIAEHITGGGGDYYYAFDGQGSVIALINTAGTQRAAYTYDPYGANATATALNGTLPNNPWRYTGGYLDPTGLYHLGARYYNPNTGSFTQQDNLSILGDPADGNRYAYASDEPVNLTDPTGMDTGSIPADFLIGCGEGIDETILVAAGAAVVTGGAFALPGAPAVAGSCVAGGVGNVLSQDFGQSVLGNVFSAGSTAYDIGGAIGDFVTSNLPF